jgi:hypothetical protein
MHKQLIAMLTASTLLITGCSSDSDDGGQDDQSPPAVTGCQPEELEQTKESSYARLATLKGSYVLNYHYDDDRFYLIDGDRHFDSPGYKSDTMTISALSSPGTSNSSTEEDGGYHYILGTLKRNGAGSGVGILCQHTHSCEWMKGEIKEEFWCMSPMYSHSDSYLFDLDGSSLEGGYIYVPGGNPWASVEMVSGEANSSLSGVFTAY